MKAPSSKHERESHLRGYPGDTKQRETQEVSYPQGQPSDAFPNVSPRNSLRDVGGGSQVISRDPCTNPSANWSFP